MSSGIIEQLTVKYQTLPDIPDIFGTLALSLIALYFVIEVINKSVSVDKMNIEMVIKMLLKLLMAKLLVDNAGDILLAIHNIFMNAANNIPDSISIPFPELMPETFGSTATKSNAPNIVATIASSFTIDVLSTLIPGFRGFSTGAKFAGQLLPAAGDLAMKTAALIMTALGDVLAQIISIFCYITISFTLFMRQLELIILVAVSPIALAGYATDEFKNTAKKFILHFAAICLQGVIIILMCKIVDVGFFSRTTDLIESWFAAGESGIVGLVDTTTASPNPFAGLVNTVLAPIILASVIGKSRAIATQLLGA